MIFPYWWRSFLAPKAVILAGALAAITFGLRLSHTPNVFEAFGGAFLVVTGGQIALWVFGIRLEMLGNTTTDAPRQFSGPEVASPTTVPGAAEHSRREASFDEKLHRLEGRTLSLLGYVMGEASIESDNPVEVRDKSKLLKAIDLGQQGYEILKKIGGPSEYMALNNLVFYSCVLNDVARSDFLLEQARLLLKMGQDHNSINLMLTGCYALLQFGDSREEKTHAIGILRALQGSSNATAREQKEASLYISHFNLK
jgi:hypothetical protein